MKKTITTLILTLRINIIHPPHLGGFMKKTFTLLALAITSLSAFAQAYDPSAGYSTEENEYVCQFNDPIKTKMYVDRDTTYDSVLGSLSPKILEVGTIDFLQGMPVSPVVVSSIARTRDVCLSHCEEVPEQIILFTSKDLADVPKKLEVNARQATLTIGVDEKGNALSNALVYTGSCEANEVY